MAGYENERNSMLVQGGATMRSLSKGTKKYIQIEFIPPMTPKSSFLEKILYTSRCFKILCDIYISLLHSSQQLKLSKLFLNSTYEVICLQNGL